MRKIAALIAVSLVSSLSLPARAEDQYRYPTGQTITGSVENDFSAGWRKMGIYETYRDTATTSWIFARRFDQGVVDWQLCDSATSGYCSKESGYQVLGASIMPPCETETQTNCIESLRVGSSQQLFDATLNRQISGFSYPADEQLGVPKGSTVSVWTSSEFPHTGGTEYSVFASLGWNLANGKLQITDFSLNVAGTTERPNNQVGVSTPLAQGTESGASGGSADCFYTAANICAYNQVFAPNTKIGATVRVSNQVSGWLYGRLKDPLISVSKFSNDSDLVVIEAEPVTVPVLQATWQQDDLPGLVDPQATGNFGGGSFMTSSTDSRAFSFLNSIRSTVADTASGVRQFWGVQSSKWVNQVGQRCTSNTKGLVGLVTTNAMVYQGGVPTFSGGFLNYQVAGMHLLPDGTEALGTYDLSMRADVARCLYGFSKAPISATITVTGSGDPRVTTTVVGEKGGWLKLAAYGFSFSQKTIKVKITQPKRSTITCVTIKKPIRTKKVTAVNPRCPKGFKKR